MGTTTDPGAYVPPRGQGPDFRCTPNSVWERSLNPNPEGNVKLEMDLNGDATNVSGGVQSNINLGFGSKTVDRLSPPRVKNSISKWGEFGLASPIPGMGPRTEVETPSARLPLALSPPPSVFRGVGEGNSVHRGGTRSVFQPHVCVPGSSRESSRYPTNAPRSGLKGPFPPRSHDDLPDGSVVDAVGGVNPRTPDRRGVRGLRTFSEGEQCIEFRFSPADVKPHIDDDEPEKRRELPGPTVRPDYTDLDNLSPGSPLSDPGVRSCSPVVGSLSPRTEVSFDSGFPADRGDYETAYALRRKLRPDRVNETDAGKTKANAGRSENDSGGAGSMGGYHPTRRLSMISADGLDGGGEFDRVGLEDVSGQVEWCTRVGASRDRDAPSSRSSSLSCSTPGSCANAIFYPGSFCAGFPRSQYPGLSSDHGSISESHLRHHVAGQVVGDVLSPGSRSYFIRHRTSISGSLKASIPPLSLTLPGADPRTCDARFPRESAGLNGIQSTSWSVQTHEHVHPRAQEFDLLRFSSSSPSRSISASPSPSISGPRHLLLDKDKLDEDRDNETRGSRLGFVRRLTLGAELRGDMKNDVERNSNTRTGLNGCLAEGAVLCRDALGSLPLELINNGRDGDGGALGYVDRVEHRDMGGPARKNLLPFNLDGRTSPASVAVSVASSPRTPVLATRFHSYNEDDQSTVPLDSRKMATRSRSTDREESEECGLLKSLLESSDPWGLMKKKVLNLPSPTLSEVERRRKRKEEDMARVRGSFGKRGVGYVTPPSMDVLIGAVGSNGEVEMGEVEEGGGDEDSQEILDFRSSQPCMGPFIFFRRTQRRLLTYPTHFFVRY